MKLNRCLEEFAIDNRSACLKGKLGNCKLKEVFNMCSIFHDRLNGVTDHAWDDHHYRLKGHPINFSSDEYFEEGFAELEQRKDLLTPSKCP